MNARQWLAGALLVNALGGYCALSAHAQSPDQREIIRLAQNSYDNLIKDGLMEFRCQVVLDWDAMYKSMGGAHNEILPFLKQTRFTVAVGPGGASTVSHQSDAAPSDVQVAERIRQSTAGVDQMITGFFQAWGPFALDSIIPNPESEYKLEILGDHYRLSYKDGPADVVVAMTMDYVETESTVSSPQFSGTFHPQFNRGKRGYFLTGLEGTYTAPSNAPQSFKVHVECQEVEGFNLPRTALWTVTVPGKTIDVQLQFTAYQIKKR